jgi:hypothetical protein
VTADFDQMVDLTGLGPHEQARLLRIHDMLVAAGPPSDLPVSLARPPAADVVAGNGSRSDDTSLLRETSAGGTVVAFPARRRAGAAILIAATVAAACFGGGYVLANQTHKSATHVFRVVNLHNSAQSPQNSEAALRVGAVDANGNWPIQLTVNGLKPLSSTARYYLMVWQHGKPVAFCGGFEVGGKGPTTVSFNVAYKITKSTRWVVTEMAPGFKYPGHVVMTTS